MTLSLIELYPNHGAIVAEHSAKEMEDICNARILPEGFAVQNSNRNIDKDTLNQILRLEADFKRDVEKKSPANSRFKQIVPPAHFR